MRIRQTELLIGAGLLFAMLVFNAALAYRSALELHEDAAEVSRRFEVIDDLDRLMSAVTDAETGQRGYIITGEQKYLEPYGKAFAVIDQRLNKLEDLVADDSLEQARIPPLRLAIHTKTKELADTLSLRKTGFGAARAAVMTDAGRQAMEAIRGIVGQMQTDERQRLGDEERANADSYRAARRSAIVAAALGLLAVVGFLWLLQRHLNARTAAAAELFKQREVLRATLASIGDGVITTDHGCQVTFLNAVAEWLTGWTLAEAEGQPLEKIFHIINEKTRQKAENPCTKVFRDGVVVGLANHTLLIGKNGHECPIDDSAAPIRDRDGRIFGAVLVFRDATKERRAADARERLAAIVEYSSDAIIGENVDGVITTWNEGAQHLFGYSAAEAIGKSIQLIVPPELRQQVADEAARIRRGEKTDYIDTVRQHKDGRRIDVSTHISPIRDNEGEVVGAAKVAHDISERRRAERVSQFLAGVTAELATLVDYQSTMQRVARLAVPFFADWCIVDMLDSQGQIRHVAHAHADPGKEPLLKELVERVPLDWNSPALSVQALRASQPQMLMEIPPALLNTIAPAPQQRKLIEDLAPRSACSAPIIIRGTPVGSLNFVTAESGRRYSPADCDLAAELARRAAVAIENAQLYQEVKEAQRQKDDFLAMLAHELRNPISAIQFANELAKVDGAARAESNEVIDRQVSNLSRLIEDLLDVSRITRDKIELRREYVDAATIVRRAVATAEPLIKSRKHTLTVETGHEPLPLFVDPTRAEQILVNLLTNAAKYTPEGGQIAVQAQAADGSVVLRVKDTGLGIPPAMLPRVFELFTQLDPSLDRAQGGLGIGLTVVRKLVELHGGSVSVASEGPGKGSEFTVRLPLAEPPKTAPDGKPAAKILSEPRRILIVDDNVDAAQSLAMLLRSVGHTVETAFDGHAALKAAEAFRPDFILLDLGLPGLDGFQVAQRLRREKNFENTRIIALSGYGQPQDRKRSQAAGFDKHLVKPVEFGELRAVIDGQPV